MQSNITFEQATEHDAEALAVLRIEAMQESLRRIGRLDPQRARDRFLSGFSPAHTQHVLVGAKKVGFFVVKQEADGLLLDHLYIKLGHQGQGIGAAVRRKLHLLRVKTQRVTADWSSDSFHHFSIHAWPQGPTSYTSNASPHIEPTRSLSAWPNGSSIEFGTLTSLTRVPTVTRHPFRFHDSRRGSNMHR